MKKRINIIFLIFFFYPSIVLAQVVITEIMYDLPKDSGADGGREWVEILNQGSTSLDLSDWRFYEAGVNHKLKLFQGDSILPSGELAIIADNPEKFLIDNAGFSGTIFDSSFSLKNTGESIILRNADLVDVDSVTYTSEQGAKGDGNSLQKTTNNWVSEIPTPGSSSFIHLANGPLSDNNNSENSEQIETPPLVTTSSATWPVKPQIFTRIKSVPKVIIVGADVLIKGEALGFKKQPLAGARYVWTFGDGGTKEGESVLYNYKYPGKYVVILNASSGEYTASDRVIIEATPADVEISLVGTGADSFVEVYNKTKYELDLSWWKLRADNQIFIIPEDTIILPNRKIIFPQQHTKFEIKKGEKVELLYPNSTVIFSYIWKPDVQTPIQKKQIIQTKKLKTYIPPAKDDFPQTNNSIEKKEKEEKKPEIKIEPKNQSANILTITNDNSNNIYKWLFGVTTLVIISIIGVLFVGGTKNATYGISKEADEYEIIEDKD